MLPGLNPKQITNLDGARQAITLLLNLVEELKQRKSYLAELPVGYEGEFGPGIRSLLTKKNERWHHIKRGTPFTWRGWRVVPGNIATMPAPGSMRPTSIATLSAILSTPPTSPDQLKTGSPSTWLEQFGTPNWVQQLIATWPQEQQLLTTLIQTALARLNVQQQARVMEAIKKFDLTMTESKRYNTCSANSYIIIMYFC